MDKKETALLIKQIDSLYPGRINLEPLTVETWNQALKKQDYQKTVATLIKYARENKFPPSVADLFIREHEAYKAGVLSEIWKWEREASGKR
jgi:hypothetical protein